MTRPDEPTRPIPPGDVPGRYPQLANHTSATSIHGGHAARTWRLEAGASRYVLRQLPHTTEMERAQTVAEVQNHVATLTGLAPHVLPDSAGAHVVRGRDGRLYTVSRYVDGRCHPDAVLDEAVCGDLGGKLGLVHRALRDVPPSPVGPPLRFTPDREAPLLLALRQHAQPDCPHPIATRALEVKLRLASRFSPAELQDLAAVPQQVIHGDVHPANVVAVRNRVVAFVDYDLTRVTPPGYELIRALLYCVQPAGPRDAWSGRALAFLRAYVRAAPLAEHAIAAMVELYRAVQVLDPHGLDRCRGAPDAHLRFGHARFALLYWLEQNGEYLAELAMSCP